MSMLFVDEEAFMRALGRTKMATLATCQNDYVSARIMTPVNIGMTLYFYTDDYSLKATQMHANPRVAITFGTYMIEGKARFLGSPSAPENKAVADVYNAKYGERFEGVGSTVVIVAVDITRLRHWIMEGEEPVNIAETRY